MLAIASQLQVSVWPEAASTLTTLWLLQATYLVTTRSSPSTTSCSIVDASDPRDGTGGPARESTRRPRKRRLVRVRAHKSPIADLASASSASGHAWIQNPCGPAPLKDRQAVMLPAFLARLAHSALLVPVRHRRSSINLNSEPRSATPGRTSIGSMSDRLRGTQTWAITRRMRCAICWRSEGCVICGAATC